MLHLRRTRTSPIMAMAITSGLVTLLSPSAPLANSDVAVGEIQYFEGMVSIQEHADKLIAQPGDVILDCSRLFIDSSDGRAVVKLSGGGIVRIINNEGQFHGEASMPEKIAPYELRRSFALGREGAPAIAGHIEDLQGEGKAHEISRFAGSGSGLETGVPVGILDEIRDCDRIYVDKGSIKIRLTDNERISIEPEGCAAGVDDSTDVKIVCSPHLVHAEMNAPTMLGNLMAGLADIAKEWREYERHAVVLGTRGDEPLDLPLLWADDNFVVEGERPLVVGWVGGAPPFAVEIAPRSGGALVAQDGVSEQVSEPVMVDLAPGLWVVSVTDAAGKVVDGVFTVVSASEVPEAPPDDGLGDMPEVLRESAEAAWLAEQDEGNWMYEAYLRAGALAGDFVPAGYLERYLASGALWQ